MILDQPPPPPEIFCRRGVASHTHTYTMGAYPDHPGMHHTKEPEMTTHTTTTRFTRRAVR